MPGSVLVTGASGLLGREVVRVFELRDWTVKGTGLSRADGVSIISLNLSQEIEVKKVLDQVK